MVMIDILKRFGRSLKKAEIELATMKLATWCPSRQVNL